MTPPPRAAALAFIFVTVLLDVLALGMVIPVLPKLVERFVGGDTARAAIVFGLFVTAWEAMQFLFSPLLGALSDRFGRRPVILLSNFGLGLDYVLMALAPSLSLLFVGRLISGITAASFSTAGAYIADVMPPEKRASGFGMLGAAFGLGFVIGPAIGGLLGGMSPRLPFWVAAAFSLANACYGLFVLPESLPPEQRDSFQWRRANPLGSLKLLRTNAQLLALGAVTFSMNLAHFVLQSTFVLYAAHRYGWSERTVGLALAAVGACAIVVQGGLTRVVVARIGERATLVVGLLAGVVGFGVYGSAPTAAVFWLGVPITSLWGLAGPSLQGLMSKELGPSDQGKLQGAVTSIMALAGIVGPAIYSEAFARGIQRDLAMPGLPFYIASLFLLVAVTIALRATRKSIMPAAT